MLVTLVDGVPYAIEDACNHAGASLSEGSRLGKCVTCPMHGYIFDLTTGALVEPSAVSATTNDATWLASTSTTSSYTTLGRRSRS